MNRITTFILCIPCFIGIQICCISSVRAQDPKNYSLQEIKVSASINPAKIMKNAAKNFAAKYSKNYAAQLLQYRSVSCNHKYCEFNAYMGVIALLDFNQNQAPLFWQNPANHIRIAPLNVLRSSAFDYNGNELELSSINTDGFNIERFSTGYVNSPIGNALKIKRSLEVYSPLNPKMIANYTYKINKMFQNNKNEQLAQIEFETIRDCFPAKCRLLGKGSILYNITKRSIESIKMDDFVDFYSTAARKDSYNGKKATIPSIEITYEHINGTIFTKSIALHIGWKKPDQITNDDFIYSIVNNARRNPFKYNLEETEYCLFSNPKELDKVKIEKLEGTIYKSHLEYGRFYSAPYSPELWQNIKFKGIDIEKVKKELAINGTTLQEQAAANGLNGYEIYLKSSPNLQLSDQEYRKYLDFSKKYYLITEKTILPLLGY